MPTFCSNFFPLSLKKNNQPLREFIEGSFFGQKDHQIKQFLLIFRPIKKKMSINLTYHIFYF